MAIFRRCYLRQRLRRCYRSLQRPVKRERTKKRKQNGMRRKSWPHIFHPTPLRQSGVDGISFTVHPRLKYRPPQDSVVSHHRAAARRLTPPAPPRPPSLHLELPKPSSKVRRVLLHDRLTADARVLSSILLANARMPAWLRPSALTPARLEAPDGS